MRVREGRESDRSSRSTSVEPRRTPPAMRNVFLTFLHLGLTSFGGPIAQIGYFRREFVERRGWIDERRFAHIVAFCSVLPGPTSSLGFTLPSAIALTIFAELLS